jgi:hypothetical protein
VLVRQAIPYPAKPSAEMTWAAVTVGFI